MIRVRFELTTHGLEDRCSIQLSYRTVMPWRNILSILNRLLIVNSILQKNLLFCYQASPSTRQAPIKLKLEIDKSSINRKDRTLY